MESLFEEKKRHTLAKNNSFCAFGKHKKHGMKLCSVLILKSLFDNRPHESRVHFQKAPLAKKCLSPTFYQTHP